MKTTLALIALILSTSASALPPRKMPECKDVFAACKAAGYEIGTHDCVDKVAEGKEQVKGVDQKAAEICRTAIRAAKQAEDAQVKREGKAQ